MLVSRIYLYIPKSTVVLPPTDVTRNVSRLRGSRNREPRTQEAVFITKYSLYDITLISERILELGWSWRSDCVLISESRQPEAVLITSTMTACHNRLFQSRNEFTKFW